MNQDYMMRMIEQFGQALLAIILARKAKNYKEAFSQIQEASQRFLDNDILYFSKMTPKDLWEYFMESGKSQDFESCVICADLLYELSLICEQEHCEEFSPQLRKLSLLLYLKTIPLEKKFQTKTYINRVKELETHLAKQEIPKIVSDSLSTYHEFLNSHLPNIK